MALHIFDGATHLGTSLDEGFDADAAFPGVTVTKIIGAAFPADADLGTVTRSGSTISFQTGTAAVASAEEQLSRALAIGVLVAVDALVQIVDHFHYSATGLPSNIRGVLDGIHDRLIPLVTTGASEDLEASAVAIQRAVEILATFPSASTGTIDGTIVP